MKYPLKRRHYFSLARIVIGLLVAGPSSHLIADTDTNAEPGDHSQKAILVTGASTGLGRMLAESLASKGYFVYAGARKDKDLAAPTV